jgi:Fe(II)/alpha-ketoglutarate-dependent arginine beta-hydroxylase
LPLIDFADANDEAGERADILKTFLSAEENASIAELLEDLAARYGSVENPEFLSEASLFAHELPRRVRRTLNDFRLQEPSSAVCRIGGYAIKDDEIGPTPSHWKDRQRGCMPVKEEILLVLLASLLGDPIAWATQQDGAVVHDIAPIKSHENEQLGSGSAQELTWHTEDAFHPFRGDYIAMMCLRNAERVPTTFAPVEVSGLSKEDVALLFEPHFTIRPDESHLRKNRIDPEDGETLEAAHDRIEAMKSRPDKIPVLSGSPESPYCRLDPYFMDPPENPAARAALERLFALVDSRLEDMVLEPGEFCFIDNFRAVHGRRPFKARFDGTDRWLKRVNVTRNLRISRTARPSAESRLIL